MVSGDICAPPPPDPEPGPTEADEVEDDRSNGLFAFWLTPVDDADDDFDDVSALRASKADDAAPKARNMAKLQQRRAVCGRWLVHVPQQAPCHDEKPNKIGLSRIRSIRQGRQ